jgi:hypothetical protein
MVKKIFINEEGLELQFICNTENRLVITIKNNKGRSVFWVDNNDLNYLQEELIYIVDAIKNGKDE